MMKRLSTSFAIMLLLCAASGQAQAENAAPLRLATAPAASALAVPATAPAIERQEIRAQLMPRRYTTVAAEIGAKVNRIPLAEGSAFKAGQLLVSFDCSLQQAQLQ